MKKKTACFISTFPNSVVYGEKGNIGRKRLQIVVNRASHQYDHNLYRSPILLEGST